MVRKSDDSRDIDSVALIEYNRMACVDLQRQTEPITCNETPSLAKSEARPERNECGDTSATNASAATSLSGSADRSVVRSQS